jgi:hypothetical protein
VKNLSVLGTLVIVTGILVNASSASADSLHLLAPFVKNTGLYHVDLTNEDRASPCRSASPLISVAVDAVNDVVTVENKAKEKDVDGPNGVYKVGSLAQSPGLEGGTDYLTVLEGNEVVTLSDGNPSRQLEIKFVDANTVVANFETLGCTYKK